MSRGLWFVAGAGVGVYAVSKARRAVESFTPEGLRDRWAGLTHGAQLFAEEVRAGSQEKEAELRERLGLHRTGPAELAGPADQDRPAEPVALASHPSHDPTRPHTDTEPENR